MDDLKNVCINLQSVNSQNKDLAQRKSDIEQEIAELELKLIKEKREGMQRINQAEFETIKDVKKLTEEMDFKVKET
jgi:hypothetical protein